MSVDRPVVRSFAERYATEAAKHVKKGGHAIVWRGTNEASFVFPVPDEDDVSDLGYWALLDLGKHRWRRVADGPLRGLAAASVPKESLDIVRGWAHRDSIWPGPKRTVQFDCLECGACCRDNRVELDDDDIAKIRAAGRHDLLRAPYTRKDEGKIVLRLVKSKDCRHLGEDLKCAIYELRPTACSHFPVASECCMFAREEELGLHDGLAPM